MSTGRHDQGRCFLGGFICRGRSRRGKDRSKQRGWSKPRKGKRETKCYKCGEVGDISKEGSESLSIVFDQKVEDDLLIVLDGHRHSTEV